MATAHFWYDEHVPVLGLEGMLWVLVGISVLGDIGTTMIGLELGLVERNPAARTVIHAQGILGLVWLKALAIGVGLGCRTLLESKYYPIIPAGLATPWLGATLINCYAIAQVI